MLVAHKIGKIYYYFQSDCKSVLNIIRHIIYALCIQFISILIYNNSKCWFFLKLFWILPNSFLRFKILIVDLENVSKILVLRWFFLTMKNNNGYENRPNGKIKKKNGSKKKIWFITVCHVLTKNFRKFLLKFIIIKVKSWYSARNMCASKKERKYAFLHVLTVNLEKKNSQE